MRAVYIDQHGGPEALTRIGQRFAVNGHTFDQFWLKASGKTEENLLIVGARHAEPLLKTRSAALPGDALFIRIWYYFDITKDQ